MTANDIVAELKKLGTEKTKKMESLASLQGLIFAVEGFHHGFH